MHRGRSRLESEGPPIARRRLLELTLSFEGDTQVIVRLFEVRLESDCLPEALYRFLQPARCLERDALIAIESGLSIVQCDSLADQIDGEIGTADLLGQDAEQMQTFGMGRIDA